MKVLIVKHGALGDVVRTSYFVGPLREKYGAELKLFWITSIGAKPLIARNPYIDHIVTRFDDIMNEQFDIIFLLMMKRKHWLAWIDCDARGSWVLISKMVRYPTPSRRPHGSTWACARGSGSREQTNSRSSIAADTQRSLPKFLTLREQSHDFTVIAHSRLTTRNGLLIALLQ